MQKRKFDILLVAMVLILCSSIHSFAQQPTSTEKRALISEFRKLTGADLAYRVKCKRISEK